MVGAALTASARTEELPVRQRGIARPPQPAERVGMMVVDDRGERASISFIADMPFGGPE